MAKLFLFFPKLHPLLSLFFLIFIPSNVSSQSIETERTILLKLKQQLGNPQAIQSWNASFSPCSWTGINCTQGSVTAVSLPNMDIKVKIPPTLCDLKNLNVLDLASNYIPGEFPKLLYNCSKLQYLDLSMNCFVGPIPDDIERLSTLLYLDVSANNFSGDIPPSIGRLPELRELHLDGNEFHNVTFPKEIGNLSNLEHLAMTYNGFAPMKIPDRFSQLKKLKYLLMTQTNLIGQIPDGIADLSSLEWLDLTGNKLEGSIPSRLLMLKNLTNLYLFHNKLSGQIPRPVEALNLAEIDLSSNNLTGTIPEEFGKMQNLVHFCLFSNRLTGEVPVGLSQLPALKDFRISNNTLSGLLPPEFGLHSKLEVFEVHSNQFTGQLPVNLCAGGVLQRVVAFSNNLSGQILASLGNCSTLQMVLLQNNHFSVSWTSLTTLDLSGDQLTGQIPVAIGSLPDLLNLDLSDNQFSGKILAKIGNLRLTSLNLSADKLSGKIPDEFDNLAYENSFLNNSHLCADNPILNLPDCSSTLHQPQKLSSKYLPLILALAVVVTTVTVTLTLFKFRDYKKKYLATWKLTPFQRLDFTEVNILSSLTDNNLIGGGGSGKVYKIGINGIRHANIVKLLCCISSENSKLLVYEYMENESLYRWLHGKKSRTSSGTGMSSVLDWPRRLQIAVGAAQGLCYMHHDWSPHITHRDVKSSNILLDSEFKARIVDFGLAKMITRQGEPHTMSAVVGSFFYLAPEYAYTTRVNEKIDVYSFGVVLPELVTGREANRGNENTSLAEWAWQHYSEERPLVELFDLKINDPCYLDEMTTVCKLGLACTSTLPSSRPSMKEVLHLLQRCGPQEIFEVKKSGREADVAPLLRSPTYISSYNEIRRGSEEDDGYLVYSV
ncbi:hypothetical protein SLA2020_218220 [Shorea laevis]